MRTIPLRAPSGDVVRSWSGAVRARPYVSVGAAFAALFVLVPSVRAGDPVDEGEVPPVRSLWEGSCEYRREASETVRGGGEEDLAIRRTSAAKMVYVDRVDAVEDGRVVKVTRYVQSASLSEDGSDVPLRLSGRSVVLRLGGGGILRARWDGGGEVSGSDAQVVCLAPLPDVRSRWGVGEGSRKGVLANVNPSAYERPPEVPVFVEEALSEFGLEMVRQGSWELAVEKADARTCKVTATVSLSGEEVQDGGDGSEPTMTSLSDRTELRLTLERSSRAALPEGQGPPPSESEEEEDRPGADDDDEPLPPPEPEPEPIPDEDDPLPEPDEDGR